MSTLLPGTRPPSPDSPQYLLRRMDTLYSERGFDPQPGELYLQTLERELAVAHMCLDGRSIDYIVYSAADCNEK